MIRPPRALVAAFAVVALAACGDEGVTLTEERSIAIVREELAAVGVDAAPTTNTVDDLEVCPAPGDCHPRSFALDGWDADAAVGFACLTAADLPGLDTAATLVELEAIQAALDALDGRTLLAFREVSHETTDLAEDQLRRDVQRAIADHGLSAAP